MRLNSSAAGRRRVAALAAVAACAAALAPATASAATGTVANGTLVYSAAPGETNDLSLTLGPAGTYQFADAGVSTMTAGAGCTLAGATVRCPIAGVSAISVDLGDGNDKVVSWVGLPTRVAAGAGNDNVITGIGADVHDGGPGSDTLDGGWGDDTLDGGTGADNLKGSLGFDTATYASRTAGVTVSADGNGGDGEPGEGDNVDANVDVLIGGSGKDTLTGHGNTNTIVGGAGDDTLDGGAGNDALDGGAGADRFTGGAGADKIAARDSVTETIGCGADADTVTADSGDSADADCEQVNRSATADPGTTIDVPGTTPILEPDYLLQAPAVAISPTGASITPAGAVAIRIACPRTVFKGCQGTVELSITEYVLVPVKSRVSLARRRKVTRVKKVTKLGQARYRLAAGETRPVQVRLSRRGKRKLAPKKTRKRSRKITLNVTALSTSSLGTTSTTRSVSFKLRG